MRYRTMIRINGEAERMLVLLSISLVALLANATQHYDVAAPFGAYEPDEPKLAYLRPLYLEAGTSGDESLDGTSTQEDELQVAARDALVDALINQWLRDDQTGPDGSRPSMKRENNDEQQANTYDVNSHLSPFGVAADSMSTDNDNQIRGPVNDPDGFEAKLGELTNALNHKMSNSLARQQLLAELLNGSARARAGELSESLIGRLEKEGGQSGDEPGDEGARGDNELNSAQDLLTSDRPADEVPTSEYIDHPLALFGHQLVQGGAGEGQQLLGPDGTFENIQVIKSDSAIPSYCEPPNPCPLGYTAADGCIENFINSASFSREYQAKQKCSCDNEHSLFNCASPMSSAEAGQQADEQSNLSQHFDGPLDESPASGAVAKLDTLARTIQNRFGELASVRKLISDQQARQQRGILDEGAQNDNEHSDYLVRSARKWSPELNYHKMELD